MILCLRTDSPEATIELWDGEKRVAIKTWEAGRQLSAQLLPEIDRLLAGRKKTWNDLSGIIVFRGPGSFTGLRIGATVANAMAYSQEIPVVGSAGDDWIRDGLAALKNGQNNTQVVPEYGAPANITKPK